MSRKTTLIIPHYGEDRYLEECLISIRNLSVKPESVKIFNNNPDPISFNLNCSKSDSDIQIFENKVNIGFTKAVNFLLRASAQADFIWLLNNDCRVEKDALKSLLKTISKRNQIGIVSSYIYDLDNFNQVCFTGGIEPLPGTHRIDESERPRKEKWVTFCSVLIRKELIQTIGLLDENYFIVSSDADFCYTARSRGFEIWSDPGSKVFHHEKHGISRANSKRTDLDLKKRIGLDQRYFFDKWNGELFRDLNLEVFPEEENVL